MGLFDRLRRAFSGEPEEEPKKKTKLFRPQKKTKNLRKQRQMKQQRLHQKMISLK